MKIYKEVDKFMSAHEFNFNLNISLKHKYVYFEVAKAACSTIKKRLLNREVIPFKYGGQYKLHADIFLTPFIKPYQLDEEMLQHILFSGEFYRFTFVRDPYTRLLSSYLEKIVRQQNQAKQILKKLNMPYDDDSLANTDLSFEQFIKAIEKTSFRQQDKHWRPQHMLLMHPFIKLDFIGKLENFDEDWAVVSNNIALPNEKSESVLWHQTNAKDKLSEHYTPDLIKRTGKIYKKDFEIYNYEINR